MHLNAIILLLQNLYYIGVFSSVQGLVTERCPVYTYFEDLPGEIDKIDQIRLLQIWLRNWYANGWNPVVLGRSDAEADPLYSYYRAKFMSLPTINYRNYELACYIRWLAFAQRDGGVFADYDIYNFPADSLPKAAGPCGKGPLLSYPGFLPMVLFGNGTETKRLIREFVTYKVESKKDQIHGRLHISDMIIARKRREYLFRDLLPNPSFLAHFSTNTKESANYRLDLIGKLCRTEWIRQNLLLHYRQTHRIRLLKSDPEGGDTLDAGIGKDGLLDELFTECMPVATAQKFLIEAFQMRKGEEYTCKFETIAQIEPSMLNKKTKTDAILLMLEDPIERVLRKYRRLKETLKDPPLFEEHVKAECCDHLVKQLTGRYNQTVFIEEMPSLLEQAKNIISIGQVILGMPSQILETKMVLEYSLGFTLTPPTVPYISPSEGMQQHLSEDILLEFQFLNQFDYILYEYAKGIFEERLRKVKTIDSQLGTDK